MNKNKVKMLAILFSCILLLSACSVNSEKKVNKSNFSENILKQHEFNALDKATIEAGTDNADIFTYDYETKENLFQRVYYFELLANGKSVSKFHYTFTNTPFEKKGPTDLDVNGSDVIRINRNIGDNENGIKYPIILGVVYNPADANANGSSAFRILLELKEKEFANFDKYNLKLKSQNFIKEKQNFEFNKKFDLGSIQYEDSKHNILEIKFKVMFVTDYYSIVDFDPITGKFKH